MQVIERILHMYFNTSHVSINLVMDGDMDMDVVFQYISCFY